MLRLVRKVVRKTREEGFRRVLAIGLDRIRWRWHTHFLDPITNRYYEWRLGIHSAGIVEWDRPASEAGTLHRYEPIPFVSFKKAMRRIGVRPDDVFLDIGSGKGRALILAGLYPFRRIIGVEISETLTAAARENIRRVQARLKCRTIDLVTADAAAYPIPPDVTVVYFFNPFSGEILSQVCRNIRALLLAAPRRLTVVFAEPGHFEGVVAQCDWLVKRCEFLHHHRWVVYNAAPQDPGRHEPDEDTSRCLHGRP